MQNLPGKMVVVSFGHISENVVNLLLHIFNLDMEKYVYLRCIVQGSRAPVRHAHAQISHYNMRLHFGNVISVSKTVLYAID